MNTVKNFSWDLYTLDVPGSKKIPGNLTIQQKTILANNSKLSLFVLKFKSIQTSSILKDPTIDFLSAVSIPRLFGMFW